MGGVARKYRRTPEGLTLLSEEQEVFLIDNYLKVPEKTLAKMMGVSHTGIRGRLKQLGLKVPDEIIAQRKSDSRFKSGHTPANKGKKQTEYMSAEQIEKSRHTWFQKGHLPKNTINQVGTVRIRTYGVRSFKKNQYKVKYIQLGLANWIPLHIHNWQLVNGPVPKGYCLWFKDGNSLNAEIENLEMITRGENAKRNKSKFLSYPEDLKENISLINQISKQLVKNKKTQS